MGFLKVSLRTVEKIDASQICSVFGGGGHARATGCFISESLERCRDQIIKAAQAACKEAGL